MRIELKPTIEKIEFGDLIVTNDAEYFLVTDNDIDLPCQCSQSIGSVLLVNLMTSETHDRRDLASLNSDTSDIKKIIKKKNLLIKEI